MKPEIKIGVGLPFDEQVRQTGESSMRFPYQYTGAVYLTGHVEQHLEAITVLFPQVVIMDRKDNYPPGATTVVFMAVNGKSFKEQQ